MSTSKISKHDCDETILDSSLVGQPDGLATLGSDGKVPKDQLPVTGIFDFDAYSNASGYSYSYDSATKTETITKDETVFATRENVKNEDGSWTITITCTSMEFTSKKMWAKTNGNWSATDIT